MSPRAWTGLVLASSLLAATPAEAAQPKPAPAILVPAPAPAPAPAAPAVPVAADSPRASVQHFFDLCRVGEWAEAAGYLDLSEAQRPDGAQLARRLKAVLDRQLWIDIEKISPHPLGDHVDKLPVGIEEIGSIPGPSGPAPVRLVRRAHPEGARWIFSRATVDHIDEWYGRLSDRWIQDHLPERLLRTGPRALQYWQWIALPILFVLALLAGKLLGWGTRVVMGRIMARARPSWNAARLRRLRGPLAMLWALGVVYLALPSLALYPPAQSFMRSVLHAGAFVALFWLVERGIDVAAARVLGLPSTKVNSAARSLVPLGARALKAAVVVAAVIATLSVLGYPATSLIAGLGIGGVAIALAAQKTVENLFGSLSIGIDQPFRIGDSITVDGLTGTVESIGLRSTRIRTLDRTLVTIPNGKLADMRIESFAARDRMKFACVLSLDRSAGPGTVRELVESVRSMLKAQPKIWSDVNVSLAKIRDEAFDVEVLAWFQTTSPDEYLRLRQETLLGLLATVEQAGIKLKAPLAATNA
ncbi:Potassium efflux system KefA protein / Small-conductance mechanosensitive channel [Minicystis rosea]|nr:Potassium efflux system KefA protein / Small-conductance mechanosensitive channel [Minicystis rosea]